MKKFTFLSRDKFPEAETRTTTKSAQAREALVYILTRGHPIHVDERHHTAAIQLAIKPSPFGGTGHTRRTSRVADLKSSSRGYIEECDSVYPLIMEGTLTLWTFNLTHKWTIKEYSALYVAVRTLTDATAFHGLNARNAHHPDGQTGPQPWSSSE